MSIKTISVITLAALFVAACQQTSTPTNTDNKVEQIVKHSSKELYSMHCISCHGAAGDAGLNGSKNLMTSTLDKAEIIRQITNGKGMMTGFEDKMTNTEIDQLADFVISLRH